MSRHEKIWKIKDIIDIIVDYKESIIIVDNLRCDQFKII